MSLIFLSVLSYIIKSFCTNVQNPLIQQRDNPEQFLPIENLSDRGKQCLRQVFSGKDCAEYSLQQQWKLTIKAFNCYRSELGIYCSFICSIVLFFLGMKEIKCRQSMAADKCLKKFTKEDRLTINSWLPHMGLFYIVLFILLFIVIF